MALQDVDESVGGTYWLDEPMGFGSDFAIAASTNAGSNISIRIGAHVGSM